MRPIWFVRATVMAAALFAASFISFPSFPGAGLFNAGLFTVNPPTMDRTFKGDRLPPAISADKIGEPASPTRQTREKVPVGCDGAFSPISSPRLANVFRRCAV
jgi:hypothetical protein